ncbi:MAG: class I SAM-dependent methyltransferase [Gammaproteobacteria bacterium]|nr:class I SAM-dependent methyltransferase [Gammaproteobacteria bacterium]
MKKIIGALHQFHDQAFVAEWAKRFTPTSERLDLFDAILSELKSHIPPNGCVVELGIGPGYLADHLLKKMPYIQYCGIDFSTPMLDIARQRLEHYSARVVYVQADLVKDSWWTGIPTPVNSIVSSWALHDLGNRENIEGVYRNCALVLQGGGMLLNGDFIKPDKAIYEYEPGRFEIANHIEILRRVGFTNAECLVVLEEEIESPTAAQNYACFKGVI